jgi:hypothetical protein
VNERIAALEAAAALLLEVYAHIDADGHHLKDKETKIWVHVSTVARMGDVLATLRDFELVAAEKEL